MIGTNSKVTNQFYATYAGGYMVFYRKQGDMMIYQTHRDRGWFEINRRLNGCAFFIGKCPP